MPQTDPSYPFYRRALQWNGFGGKIDAGETVLAAALREMKEESCLDILDAAYVGRIIFEFEAEPEKLEVREVTAGTHAWTAHNCTVVVVFATSCAIVS